MIGKNTGLTIAFMAAGFVVLVVVVALTESDTANQDQTVTEQAVESQYSRILYVTNRQRTDEDSSKIRYGGERGEVSFGKCVAEFTPIPFAADLAEKLPFYLKEESNRISDVAELEDVDFWKELEKSAESTTSGAVVLFVHGYSYGFERNCDMAAEMQRTLEGKATVVAFSWPSNGLPSDYVSDLSDVEWSTRLLGEVIEQLHERLGADRIRVAAHSMGSRGVVLSLMRLAGKSVDQPVIGDLVLLAPDVDTQTFTELLPTLEPFAGHITLYASDKDTPLKLSRQLSGYPRLGEAGEFLTVLKEMDTIDVSSSGRRQITGHEYFFYNHLVVADLVELLETGAPASDRTGLEQRTQDGLPYWRIE